MALRNRYIALSLAAGVSLLVYVFCFLDSEASSPRLSPTQSETEAKPTVTPSGSPSLTEASTSEEEGVATVPHGVIKSTLRGKEIEFHVPQVEFKYEIWRKRASKMYSPKTGWDGQGVLGVNVGEPITSGLLILDGEYIPPPYRLKRIGACYFINERLVSYTWFWHRYIDPSKGYNWTPGSLAEGLDDSIDKWREILSEGGLVEFRQIYGDPDKTIRVRTHCVEYLEALNITKDTYVWGEMIVSSIATTEKMRLSREIYSKKGKIAFPLMRKRGIERLTASDSAAFMKRLQQVVDAAQEKARNKTENSDRRKNLQDQELPRAEPSKQS